MIPPLYCLVFLLLLSLFLYLIRPRKLSSKNISKDFWIKPYLQLGYRKNSSPSSLSIVWYVEEQNRKFNLRYQVIPDSNWQSAKITSKTIEIPGHQPTYEHMALLDVPYDSQIIYQVLEKDSIAFAAQAKTIKGPNSRHTFAVIGDLGTGKFGTCKIAHLAQTENPDMIVAPGDIVYPTGTVSQYLEHFFPVYNSNIASSEKGAPLLRSTLFIPAIGNHDVGKQSHKDPIDFNQAPDLLGYFVFWKQPLNGPNVKLCSFPLKGNQPHQNQFICTAGHCFPKMANFSFDFGNAHWTVLDANVYVDWSQRELLDWLAADLNKNKNAKWRFVSFHHPGFCTDGKHLDEQRMRLLSPLFEAAGVDIVFSGHAHCYERSFPLKFKPKSGIDQAGQVDGDFIIDKSFDGKTNTRAHGVIYIVSGGGGATLYPDYMPKSPAEWQSFTAQYYGDDHSFTICQLDDHRFAARQISASGLEVDNFTIEK